MKTAISLPDVLYKNVETMAKDLGIPRSQLFVRALEEFIVHHTKEDITEKYTAVYSRIRQNELESQENVNLASLRELTKNDTW